MDQVNLTAWEGRTDTQRGGVSEQLAAQLHATLGNPRDAAPVQGDVLPALWHWCAFPPATPMSELGADGHPYLGGFLPPVRLDRRMWAGGALQFGAPLRVGERLEKRSSIRSVLEKAGAAGPMVFVTVDHAIYGESGLAISERQDIVYLAIPDSYTPPKKRAMPSSSDVHTTRSTSETLLMRYSAVTFNAHRIHYDLPYTLNVEHYPGLVVHGPLQATLLMQTATAHKGRMPHHFDFRGVHPMFAGETLEIMATQDDPETLSMVTGTGGHQCMQATAIWEGTV
ncbi:Mesaconyl-C(4)-CoA hydratase [Ascidiaceihabitans donghaensis]|uniref:Mesaconyl-C(4)-CoA hydratase n=1 Tax=Ascidiaceihabitans donghaensis TaxID=1510460 RepID=A0A2R8BHF5_9RHOB|nr:MaoC family dehydratase N-terminal domain-containing protein [Ascidiaceihabitans donghaensis]SPH22554.1 Mesaconyl-C(4)-CoA hydratase [Ascidiaceihabitans donghaensis]